MSKALVTGGTGFLGSFIADVLSEQGLDVVIFDKKPSPYLQQNQTMVVGDIMDADAVKEAVKGCKYVFHLAGLADLNAGRTQPVSTVLTNINGTVNMLEAAREASVERFLFASTVYVYSREGSFYRCSKQACEAYIEEYRRSYGVNYTILRYGSLYGPRSDDTNGVFRLMHQASEQGWVDYKGLSNDAREYIHVEDAARLTVNTLAEEYINQHLVITGHHPIRISDLFTMFSEIFGRPIEVNYGTPGSTENRHYSITPYAYTPTVGRKLTSNCYVDMGQGLLQLAEEIHRQKDEAEN